MNTPLPSRSFQPQCKHLRNKEMYYEAPGQEDTEFASNTFWCAKTQESFGPDGEPACKTDCCTGRSCCIT